MNIWVCNLAGVLGYAQFPHFYTTDPNTDGVVVTTTAFGRTGNVVAPFNLGRTATHEVGHWLNLRHIWGDEVGCGGDGDFVADTPDQYSQHYFCPPFPQTSCSSNDMFMNYMDYTNDGCMNIFTLGQRNRMRALFASGGVRGSFIENAMGMSITGPDQLCASETYTVENLPAGATVTWSASPSWGVTLSGSGDSPTVTRLGDYNGWAAVTATIATDCGDVDVHRDIHVGFPHIECTAYANAIEPVDGDYPCPYETGAVAYLCSTHGDNMVQIKTDSPSGQFEVQIRSYPSLTVLHTHTVLSTNPSPLHYTPSVPGWYNIRVRAINHPCGATGPWYEDDVEFRDCYNPWMGGENWKVFPDPSSETLTVVGAAQEVDRSSPPVFKAALFDGQDRQLRQGESKDGEVRFDTRTLPEGTYVLHIHHDGEVEKRQVVILHE